MIYKTLKKVSDVCQLFIPDDTHTVAGVTITNNGDGSFTIDGTGTGSGTYTNFTTLGKNNMPYKISDKLFISAYVISGTCSFLFAGFSHSGNPNISLENPAEGTYYSGNISKKDEYNRGDALGFFVGNNTFNNFRVKFNIINLTEMYGAGNEPTTVEQFRQDFPEELYDYKPYCFVKSYKNCLTCTTKNLFDISKVTETNELKVIGNSICSYNYPVVTNDTNLLSIFKSLKPNTNYTMSATTLNYLGDSTNNIVLIFSNANDEKLIFYNYSAGFNKVTFSLTQEQINNITYVYFYGRDESSGGPTMWSNIQIEEGSTATEYQPYGYIQSRKKSLICTTKNLFDISKVKETDTLKIIGNSIYSYKYPAATEEASTLSIFKSLKPDTNYTISAFCPNFLGNGTNEIILAFNNNTTIHVFDNYAIGFAQKTFSLTQEQIDNIIRIYFYGSPESNGGPIIWSNIQIEEGDTATEYHQYGHL